MMHMSRLAFIRHAIARHIGHFQKREKPELLDLFETTSRPEIDFEVRDRDVWFDD